MATSRDKRLEWDVVLLSVGIAFAIVLFVCAFVVPIQWAHEHESVSNNATQVAKVNACKSLPPSQRNACINPPPSPAAAEQKAIEVCNIWEQQGDNGNDPTACLAQVGRDFAAINKTK